MVDTEGLIFLEIPRRAADPMACAMRVVNIAYESIVCCFFTLLHTLFAGGLVFNVALRKRNSASGEPSREIDRSALLNPEGSILVVDTAEPPYVWRFHNVPTFVTCVKKNGTVASVSVNSVGKSARGSAALVSNVASALSEPVAAIAPGYGVADVFEQALGGWYGFEVSSRVEQIVQRNLAKAMTVVASVGRDLQKSAPRHLEARTGVPAVQRGSGSPDVLHAVLSEVPKIWRLFGHSKGALVIANAVGSLP